MLRAERGFRVAFREWQAKMKSWNECFSPLKIKKQIRKEQKKKGGRKKENTPLTKLNAGVGYLINTCWTINIVNNLEPK